jgi:4'-phosphopantetheinyl transferase
MPLVIYQREIQEIASLMVWNASESTPRLLDMAQLSEGDKAKLLTIPLEKRKREWLTSKILLNLLGNGRTIVTLPSGKPILHPTGHISISHCGNLVGMVVSPHPVGLDIQMAEEKIKRIQNKFCHPKELEEHVGNPHELEELTVIWSAKEAIFKYFGENVDFANHIRIEPFNHLQEEIRAQYNGAHGQCHFILTKLMLQGHHIVVCTLEP